MKRCAMRGWHTCVAVAYLLLMAGGVVAAETRIVAGHSELLFDGSGPVPVSWTLCAELCEAPATRRAHVFSAGDGYLRVTEGAARASAWVPQVEESAEAITVRFSGSAGQYVYRLARDTGAITLSLPPGQSLQLASGREFVPQQLPGFGQIYSRVRPVQVSASGQTLYEDLSGEVTVDAAAEPVWTGLRNRYWTVLVQPATARAAVVAEPMQDQPVVSFAQQSGAATFHLYAGPIEWGALKAVSPELSEMLFAALWDFLRALTFGMMLLLGFIHGLVGNYGVAIVLLSLTVKVLMYPLTALADSWQRDVNATHSLLKPDLDAVKREYKGEEAHKRTLEVYSKHNVSQFYTFKSAAGFLIQIPVFIAAFDMLAENIALSEMGFLWITDLAKPDHFMGLPVTLPFFGAYLNLLPFLMTFLSALAALLQAETTLTADLQRQQSLRLYLMSAAFFVLFYTFPSGMVLYWTSSNLFHLLKVESGRLFMRQ